MHIVFYIIRPSSMMTTDPAQISSPRAYSPRKGASTPAYCYWFYRCRYTITPVLLLIPIFVLLGWAIPSVMYRHAAKHSVVERLRDTES